MTKRFAALKAARLSNRELGFWGRAVPKCPHCGHDYDIQVHEAWRLYEEGAHEIECPSCDLEYVVSVDVSYSYSTDEQEEEYDE